MSELILHVGMPKTGTTSLQRFFYSNRALLAKHGVNYPVFTQQDSHTKKTNGAFLHLYCCEQIEQGGIVAAPRDVPANLKTLERSLQRHPRTLLSEELFTSLYLPKMGNAPFARRFELLWCALSRALDNAGADFATVVVYLRRQDEKLATQWKNNVKVGDERRPLGEFLRDHDRQCAHDYHALLEIMKRSLQVPHRLVVRRYDRGVLSNGASIYQDFCEAVDIPWDDAYVLPRKEANSSISYDVAEAMRVFAGIPSWLRWSVLVPLASDLTKQYPDPPGTTPFTKAQARAVMEPFLEGNQEIGEHYLGGAPLFSEAYGDRPTWVPQEERIAEFRQAFERAIEQAESLRPWQRKLEFTALELGRSFCSNLPEGIASPLKSLFKRMIGTHK